MNIEVLYFEGCPNHLTAIEMVREILKSLGRQDEIHQVEVRTQADAEATAFVGSPSIRVNGADIEPWARTAKALGLSCRTYQLPEPSRIIRIRGSPAVAETHLAEVAQRHCLPED